MDDGLAAAARAIESLPAPDEVRERRRELLARIRERFGQLGTLAPEERRAAGRELNRLKQEVERQAALRLRELEAATRSSGTGFDPDLPVPAARVGRVHPTITVLRRMNSYFTSLGFDVVDG